MPTRAGMGTGVFGTVALAAGRVFGIFELYIVAAAVLALLGCAVVWVFLNRRSLHVERLVRPDRLHVGDMSLITLALSNQRLIPTPVAQVTDEVDGGTRADAQVPPLRRGETTRASYRVPAETRGLIQLGPMRTKVTDPFGLASATRSTAPDSSLLALPAYDRVPPPPKPSGALESRPDRAAGRIGPTGDEFSALRSYVIGDDLRKVHWPSTARAGELVVRTEHIPEEGDLLLLLDTRRRSADPDVFERMVSATTSLAIASFERGDDIRLLTTDGADLHAVDRFGFDRLLDHLALVGQTESNHLLVADTGRGASSAVAVLGSNRDLFGSVRSDGSQASTSRGTPSLPTTMLAVQFLGTGAIPSQAEGQLPSRRMISIGPESNFAASWASLVGIPLQATRP